MIAKSILGILPAGVVQTAGRIILDDRDMVRVSQRELRSVRGATIGLIFQETMKRSTRR